MRVWWSLVLVWGACGRVGFEQQALDATVDDLPDAEVEVPIDFSKPFGPEVAQTQLNTAGTEEDPTLTDDLLEIVFEREGELFFSTRPDSEAQWATPLPIDEINSGGNAITPEISGDGLRIDFTSNRGPAVDSGDLFRSTRPNRSAAWGPPVRHPLSSSSYEDSMSTNDADTLAVFIRNEGGSSGADIYLARRPAEGEEFELDAELVLLNTAEDEFAPFFHDLGQSIYFSTASRGGKDLMRSTRPDPSSPFEAPVPVPGLDTPERESDPWVSPDGRVIFYSANRDGGSADLYMAIREE